jgi:hypothetical protein
MVGQLYAANEAICRFQYLDDASPSNISRNVIPEWCLLSGRDYHQKFGGVCDKSDFPEEVPQDNHPSRPFASKNKRTAGKRSSDRSYTTYTYDKPDWAFC